MITNNQLALIALVLILVLLWQNGYSEGMSATRERATKIYNWFSSNEDPKYVDYRDEIEGGHNLEYYDVKNLKHRGAMTVDSIEKVITS